MNYLYDTKKPYYSFQYLLYNKDNDTSELFVKLPVHEFLYKRNNEMSKFKTVIEISCKLILQNPKMHHSTKKIVFEDSINYKNPTFQIYRIPLYTGNITQSCILEVIVRDVNKNQNFSNYLTLYRQNQNNRQNFYLEHKQKGMLFEPFLSSNDTFRIIVSTVIKHNQLQIRYYKPFRDIALPPFSTEELLMQKLTADSIFYLQIDSGKTDFIKFKKHGIYQCVADVSTGEGCSIFIMEDGFPSVIKPYQMIQPIRYLTPHKEFVELEQKKNQLKAVEDFWLKVSADEENARNNIREFYTRVKQANQFFTSYKEGWRTDRGMIFIVYGPPNTVYKSAYEEIWGYGFDQHYNSVDFKFIKTVNPFTDNDFSLVRIINYKDSWHRAVKKWINN